jgi:diguanylate cyclase (GGDEF)-like protein
MPAAAAEGTRPAHPAGFTSLNNPRSVAFLFAGLIALQAIGYLILGTGHAGRGFSELILCFHNLLALSCARTAFRRARGAVALFWLLFIVNLLFLMVPTVLMTVSTILDITFVSLSTWRVLFCLYGAPIVMMLFLPETDQRGSHRSQIFLDQFQVAIVVGLGYTTFFYLPLQRMVTFDALIRNFTISNLLSLFLLVAVFVRLQFAGTPSSRMMLQRLGTFLLSCAAVTLIGNWIDLHNYVSASAWFDIGWALPYFAAGLVSVTWTPELESQSASESTNFLSFLGTNLVLVAVLFCMDLMLDDWKRAHGALLTNAAFAASLMAFTFRLALTQYGQQQEIIQRKAAQEQLSAANETIGGLLEEARLDTSAVTQISEIGALMQGCGSRDEAFRLVPERMVRLFPRTSGMLSVLNSTRNRAEVVAEWGHIASKGESISIPLIAHEEAVGVLVIQDDGPPSSVTRPPYANEAARRRQLASSVAEHIALTVSNLDLREALQLQATRDPLTGLYNRRYMQEALERELHRARRRERPLSVMMLDIDHFKRYNDKFGHAAGDDALRLVGETLLGIVRAEDLACRYGGEEFVIILPECPLEQAGIRANEVRARLKELYLEREGELPDVVTVSIGVAAFLETTDRVDLLIKFADEALYHAKHDGRDQVAIARPELPQAAIQVLPAILRT